MGIIWKNFEESVTKSLKVVEVNVCKGMMAFEETVSEGLKRSEKKTFLEIGRKGIFL